MKKLNRILFIAGITVIALGSSFAGAAQYDLKEMTPQVQAAISGRQSRYEALQNLKTSGAVGEDNRGYVTVRGNAEAAGLVNAENQDRRTIYQAIVEQNNLGGSGLSIVESVFAEVQREKARPGDWIQKPSGEWTQK